MSAHEAAHADASTVVRVGVVGDLHHDVGHAPGARRWHNDYEVARVEERLTRGLRLLRDAGADGLLVLGDLSERGDDESTARVLALCRDAFARVGVVPGNHDGPRLAQLARAAGATPLERDDIALGTIAVGGVGVTPVGDAASRFASRGVRAPLDTPLVASHFPVLSPATEIAAAGLQYPGDLVDRDAVHAAVAARDPVVVVSGHVHGRTTRADGAVLQLTFAALVEAPYEVSILELATDGDPVVTRRSYRLGPPRPFEPVFAPDAETWSWTGIRWRRDEP